MFQHEPSKDRIAAGKHLKLRRLLPILTKQIRIAEEQALSRPEAILMVVSDEVQRSDHMRIENQARTTVFIKSSSSTSGTQRLL